MAGSAVIGTLRAILSLDTAEFDSASARVSQSAKAWTKDFNSIGQQATKLGTTLTTALTLPLVGLGAGAAKLAMDFESSFAGVKKTVEATEPEFAAMAQAFRDLSKEIPVNVNELNKLGEAAGALGIPKEEIVDFTRVMALLGVTTDLTSDQAATAIGKIQNIFNAAGKDTENFASALVALGNAGASTETEIVEMAQRIAGAGQVIGISQAEVLGFASTLASVGINAEAGGSAISRVFLKMNDSVQAGGKQLAEFARVAGMSSAQFKQAFQADAAGAVTAFIQGLGRVKASGENVNGVIEGLTGKNIILKDTLLRLSGAGELLADQLEIGNKAWKDNTALTAEAEKRFETTASQITLLWNKVKDLGISLGDRLLPMIKQAVQMFDDLVPYLESAVKWFTDLNPKVQLAGVAFLGIVAAAGPALFFFGQIATALGTITSAFATNGIAMKALTALFGEGSTAVGIFGRALALIPGGGWLIGGVAAVITASGAWDELFRIIKAGAQIVIDLVAVVFNASVAFGKWIIDLPVIREIVGAVVFVVKEFAATIEWLLGLGARFIEWVEKLTGGLRALTDNFDELSAKDIASPFKKLVGEGLKAISVEEGLRMAQEMEARAAAESARATAASAEAKSKATAEAKKHAEEIERENKALEALIPTQKGVNQAIKELTDREEKLIDRGVPLIAALKASEKELLALQKRAKDAGVEFGNLNKLIADYDKSIRALSPAHRALAVAMDFSTAAAMSGAKAVKLLSLESIVAKRDADDLADAYETLGVTTSKELHKAAAEARKAYQIILESGTATADQLIAARQRVLDAEIAAGERTVSIWETKILPAVEGVVEGISASVARGITDLIGHWNRHAEIFSNIWQGIKNTFLNVLQEMLHEFIESFLKKLIANILGAQLGKWLGISLGTGGGGGGIPGVPVNLPGMGGGGAGGAGGVGSAGYVAGQVGTTVGILDGLVSWLSPDGTGLIEGMIDVWKHPYTPEATNLELAQQMYDYQGNLYPGLIDFLNQHPELWPNFPDVPQFAKGSNGFMDFGAGTLAMLHGREAVVPQSAAIDASAWAGSQQSFSGNVYIEERLVGRAMFKPIVREAARQQVTQR